MVRLSFEVFSSFVAFTRCLVLPCPFVVDLLVGLGIQSAIGLIGLKLLLEFQV